MEHEQLRLPAALVGDLAGGGGSPRAVKVEARAEIGRLQASGYGAAEIARSLNSRGVSTPSGRGRWWPDTVRRHADPVARQRWAEYIRRYRARTR